MSHPHFPEEHVHSVQGFLGLLKGSLKKLYDGPSAVVEVRENRWLTEVTLNGVPVFRVVTDRKGTRGFPVVQDWDAVFDS